MWHVCYDLANAKKAKSWSKSISKFFYDRKHTHKAIFHFGYHFLWFHLSLKTCFCDRQIHFQSPVKFFFLQIFYIKNVFITRPKIIQSQRTSNHDTWSNSYESRIDKDVTMQNPLCGKGQDKCIFGVEPARNFCFDFSVWEFHLQTSLEGVKIFLWDVEGM